MQMFSTDFKYFASATMEEQRQDLIVQFKQERHHWEQEKLKLESDLQEAKAALNQMRDEIKTRDENAMKDSQLGVTMEAVSLCLFSSILSYYLRS